MVFDDDRMVDWLGQPFGNGFHPFGKNVSILVVAGMLPPAVNNLFVAKPLILRSSFEDTCAESV